MTDPTSVDATLDDLRELAEAMSDGTAIVDREDGAQLGPALAALISAYEALRAERAWRPIEDAPEMQEVMLYFPDAGHVIGLMKRGGDYDTVGCMSAHEPTHWRPLPQPPGGDNDI